MNTHEEKTARDRLKQQRKALVLAAERVIEEQFSDGKRLTNPKKTQFSNLIGLCNEAECSEEIENYLHYQAGRGAWDRAFTKKVIESIQPILKELGDVPDATRVNAWKLYATYLTRAYVYHDASAGSGRGYERSSR